MKTKLFCAIALFLGLALPGFARLGETLDQCKNGYGSPTGQNADGLFFSADHLIITVHFLSDRSIQEDFGPDSGGTVSEAQVADILQKNAEGSTWEVNGDTPAMITYFRKDGRAVAQCAKKGMTLTAKGAVVVLKYTAKGMHE